MKRSRSLIRGLKRTGAGFGIGLLLAGAFLGYRQLTGNFHTVVPGVVYRSAQPTAEQLTEYVRDHGIRSIIDLRGAPKPESARYQAEYVTAQKLDVVHYEFRMSANKELDQQEAAELIELMRHAEKPVLIHCQAGADRSGLASALYVAAIADKGEEAAERQISFWYGHISLPGSAAFAMDRTWEKLEPWLGFAKS